MAANEIEERLAAAAWVRAGSAGGEAIHLLDPASLRYRSRISFQNRLITTTDASLRGLVILPLDRVFSRTETAVFGCRLGTVQRDDADTSRASYPDLGTPPDNVAQIAVEPIHLDWLGPDLTAPLFLPFGFAPASVPLGFDLNLYNALAVLLPFQVATLSGDFCVAVFEHAKPEVADQPVQAVLPAEPPPVDPILALNPIAWWRGDDYDTVTGEGGTTVSQWNSRSPLHGEGSLIPDSDSIVAPLEPDTLFNNQLVMSPFLLTPSSPDEFWDFMASDNVTTFLVWAPRDDQAQLVYTSQPSVDTPEFFIESDPGSDIITWDFGVEGQFDAPFAAAEGVVQLQTILVKAGVQNITITCTTPGTDGGNFVSPPPGTVLHKLVFNGTPAGGEVSIAEAIFFDRSLTVPEIAIVTGYLTTRYGV